MNIPIIFEPLLKPLSYVRIRHEKKRYYDLYVPATITIISSVIVFASPVRISVLGQSGILEGVGEIVHFLVGFFIAALAAVATFPRPTMDEPLSGAPAKLWQKVQGKPLDCTLTRRQFISFLFGYLAFLSLALAVLRLMLRILSPIIFKYSPDYFLHVGHFAGVFVIFFLFWNLVTTTLLGLFYLTERIHRIEPRRAPPPETGE